MYFVNMAVVGFTWQCDEQTCCNLFCNGPHGRRCWEINIAVKKWSYLIQINNIFFISRIFHRGVPSYVTDCPSGVCFTWLITCLLCVNPLFAYMYFKRQMAYIFDIWFRLFIFVLFVPFILYLFNISSRYLLIDKYLILNCHHFTSQIVFHIY